MSLQHAAQHLASKGRGKDKMLVHMDKGEVDSLQKIAMANGGSLTINPQTGLPEAGFLSSMLPMLAGMALAPATGGASLGITSALQTAALVGAGSYLLNPKGGLMGGLKAGLGAYGGAGLGEALAQQGMQQAAGQKLSEEAAKNAAESSASNVMARTVDPSTLTNAGVDASRISGMSTPLDMGPGSTQVLSPLQYGSTMTPEQLAAYKPTDFAGRMSNLGSGINSAVTSPGGASNLVKNMGGGFRAATTAASALSPALLQEQDAPAAPVVDKDMGQRYSYSPGVAQPLSAADVPTYEDMLTKQGNFGSEQNYYPTRRYAKVSNDEAKNIYGFADGGPVEQMSNQAMMGVNTMYPMANISTSSYGTPDQMASGGLSDARYNLGGYSDGGRLLRGPGDGVSDSIPAVIGKRQPARLADGEFVVPARIVSEIGNGSTEAGARKLYGMMDRVQAARRQTVGKGKVAKNSRADKYLPA